MKGADGFLQGYNAQAAVEPDLQLIVGQTVTEAQRQRTVAADGGSDRTAERAKTGRDFSGQRLLLGEESGGSGIGRPAGTTHRRVTLPTERQKHDEYREACPKGPLPKGATRVDRMRRKLKTKAGKTVYAARKAIVEPVFGQIKQARGFRQFLLRGVDKVRGEWSLVCLTHNILQGATDSAMSKKPPPEAYFSVLISTDRTM